MNEAKVFDIHVISEKMDRLLYTTSFNW